jgi:hypothetical protein
MKGEASVVNTQYMWNKMVVETIDTEGHTLSSETSAIRVNLSDMIDGFGQLV